LLERVGSVKCLIVLIIVCIRRELTFKELVSVSGLKRSTAWSCLERLENEGMVEVFKAITLRGPRTLVKCTRKGSNAINELKEFLKGGARGSED